MNEVLGLDITTCIDHCRKVIDSGPINNEIISLEVKSTNEGVFLEIVSESYEAMDTTHKPGEPIEHVYNIVIEDHIGRIITINDVYITKHSFEYDHNSPITRSELKFSSISRDVIDSTQVYCTIATVTNLKDILKNGTRSLTVLRKSTLNNDDYFIGKNFKLSKQHTSDSRTINTFEFDINGLNISLIFSDNFGNGYLLFEGIVSQDFISSILDVLSFFIGRKINSIATKFIDVNSRPLGFRALPKTISSKKVTNYLTNSPIPIGKINSEAINSLYNSYDKYKLKHIFWSYFQALDVSSEKRAVYYGGCIESFQSIYLELNKQKISGAIIKRASYRKLKNKFIAELQNSHISEAEKALFQRSIENMNRLPQKAITQKFFDTLNLDVRELEMTAWNRRNDAAHGNLISDDDYTNLFRHNLVLHCLFNRMLLSSLGVSNQYIDYYTYGFPTRHISSCIPITN
ncbi:hypothetical protein [Vibrio splendidus]|uniref:hypothetical protein n=1 Tax=Vibrio splendidus TaxID=29497 RepID=UPI002117D0F8|nr:hypothetical protein [Vibrio splendidus]MCQ8869737.1 hypothetical protein [Vibrio splendidus]